MPGGWVVVEFVGGHLDGAQVKMPAGADGGPVGELHTLAGPGLATGVDRVGPVPQVRYRRQATVVGGEVVGWRMTSLLR